MKKVFIIVYFGLELLSGILWLFFQKADFEPYVYITGIIGGFIVFWLGEKLNIGKLAYGILIGVGIFLFIVVLIRSFPTLNKKSNEIDNLFQRNDKFYSKGFFPDALNYFKKALNRSRDIKDRAGEGASLNNIGSVYNAQSKYPEALSYYEQALVIRRQVGDRVGEGMSLNNIGSVYMAQGKYPEAFSYYEQALVIGRTIGNKELEIKAEKHLEELKKRMKKL